MVHLGLFVFLAYDVVGLRLLQGIARVVIL